MASIKAFDWRRAIAWLPAVAGMFALVASGLGVFGPVGVAIAMVCTAISVALGIAGSIYVDRRELELSTAIAEANALIVHNHPSRWTAAAITGQSELATMMYSHLRRKLEGDYPVLTQPVVIKVSVPDTPPAHPE